METIKSLNQPDVNKNWPISVGRFCNKLQRNRASLYSDFCCTICCKTLQQLMTHVQLLLCNQAGQQVPQQKSCMSSA